MSEPPGSVVALESQARYHVLLFQFKGDLDRHMVSDLRVMLDDAIKTPAEATTIDLWLHSHGGDAHAAYKLALELRCRCSTLRAIVPEYAKSAATLLLLGVDEIYMAPSAELGPLDVQVEHHNREGTVVSGLDVTGSLEYLLSSSMEAAIAGGANVIKYTGLPRNEVLGHTLQFMANILRPAIDKLDPHLIHQAAKQLEVAQRYGERLLGARNVNGQEELDPNTIRDLMNHLVGRYPAHEFVISRNEAALMKLPIRHADAYDRWDAVRSIYHAAFR